MLGLRLVRPRGKSAQIGPLLREGIVEIAPDTPAERSLEKEQLEQHDSFHQCLEAQKRLRSPDAESGAQVVSAPSLFPLEREQILDAVSKAISVHICHDRAIPVAPELAIFDESHIEGPPFSGGEQEIRELLQTMVNLNLDPNVRASSQSGLVGGTAQAHRVPSPSCAPSPALQALIVASVFIERLVQLVRQKRGHRDRLIAASAARAIILTMVLLASKFNFDEGVRMKHVRADSDACKALGPGIVNRFSKLEEYVLILFNWQLRVTATEYAAHYARLVDSQRAVSLSMRVMSVPSSLFLLGDGPTSRRA